MWISKSLGEEVAKSITAVNDSVQLLSAESIIIVEVHPAFNGEALNFQDSNEFMRD